MIAKGQTCPTSYDSQCNDLYQLLLKPPYSNMHMCEALTALFAYLLVLYMYSALLFSVLVIGKGFHGNKMYYDKWRLQMLAISISLKHQIL